MKLTTLREALSHYICTAHLDSNERLDVVETIEELARVEERYTDSSRCEDAVCVVTINDITQLLNIATYDIYGRLAVNRPSNHLSFVVYAEAVRSKLDVELTDTTLESGYFFIHDLWQDNEELGCNNADGTFNKTT